MSNLNREDMEARYVMFQNFSLDDQRGYYDSSIQKYRQSSAQVNRIRATIALFTGITSAAVGLITAMNLNDCTVSPNCGAWLWAINFLIVLATGLPALLSLTEVSGRPTR